MDLTGRRVAVTGAGGFIGSTTTRRLLADGASVAGLDLDAAAGRVKAAGAEFRACDVTDPHTVRDALEGCDAVVHTAAIVTDWGPMADFVRVNVQGTRNVLNAARGAGIERTVHVSSIAIWGYEFDRELGDDAEPRPCGVPYIDTKGDSDVIAREAGAVVVRPGDVYGPGSIPWSLRPLEALRARRFAVPRRGLITPVYVDDLVDCIARALELGAEGRAYTAWAAPAVSPPEFFGFYARMLGRNSVPTLPAPALLALAAADEGVARIRGTAPTATRWAVRYFSRTATYSTERAHEELGWKPRVDLGEGMRRTERWLRAEGHLPAA